MTRILFVDDEAKILDGLRRMLHGDRGRWEMRFALSGAEALSICAQEQIDIVVSDLRMPEMDGATLLAQIQKKHPAITRIVLSGYSESSVARRAVSVAHRFLNKPCEVSEIRATVERVIALQSLVGASHIRSVVGRLDKLPSLSGTYHSLTVAARDPNASLDQIAAIVEHDVAMAAKVLQLTNSAFFGLSQHVSSISTAVAILGVETLKCLALASEAFRVFIPNLRGLDFENSQIQQHSLDTARIAGTLPLDPKIRDLAVTAALLHDVGRLFLASAMYKEYSAVSLMVKERRCAVFEAEEELLGASHAEIGAYLLGLWGIPELVIEAIAYHHHPTNIPHTGLDCTTAVFLADLLAHDLERPYAEQSGPAYSLCYQDQLEALGVWGSYEAMRGNVVDLLQLHGECVQASPAESASVEAG